MIREGFGSGRRFIYKDTGMLFSLSVATIMLSYYSMMSNTWILLLQSIIISVVCFLVFSYSYTMTMGRPEMILLKIALGIYVVDSLLILMNDSDILVSLSLLVGTMGLALSIIKESNFSLDTSDSKKSEDVHREDGKKGHRTKQEEIDRELDDPWKEQPHVIYDNFELEKFDI